MKVNKTKLISIIITAAFLSTFFCFSLTPLMASAQVSGSASGSAGADGEIWPEGLSQTQHNDPAKLIGKLTGWAFMIFMGIFIVAMLVGGAMYAIGMNTSYKETGMKTMQAAIVAAVLALAAGLIWFGIQAFYGG